MTFSLVARGFAPGPLPGDLQCPHTPSWVDIPHQRAKFNSKNYRIGNMQLFQNYIFSKAGMYNPRPAKTFHSVHREQKLLWGRQLPENNASNFPA